MKPKQPHKQCRCAKCRKEEDAQRKLVQDEIRRQHHRSEDADKSSSVVDYIIEPWRLFW